jgi:hypothetical protein
MLVSSIEIDRTCCAPWEVLCMIDAIFKQDKLFNQNCKKLLVLPKVLKQLLVF